MIGNKQAPEPYHKGDGLTVDVHSVFYTLQGEGPFAGRPAVFVRLAGCNLQCPGCDTEYTQGRVHTPVEDVLSMVRDELGQNNAVRLCRLIVLTGGEPLRQNIDILLQVFSDYGFHVQIESNGVFEISDSVQRAIRNGRVTLIVSPKTSRINAVTAMYVKAFKYVIAADQVREDDGLPILALGHKAATGVARPPETWRGIIYVSPMDAQDPAINQANLLAARDSALKHGHTLGVQIHKIINLP